MNTLAECNNTSSVSFPQANPEEPSQFLACPADALEFSSNTSASLSSASPSGLFELAQNVVEFFSAFLAVL